MMKKIMIMLLAVALAPLAAKAETPEQVMKNVAAKIMRAPSLTVKFSATSSQGGTAMGTLVMSGSKFTMTGSGYGVWYNGRDMWSYSSQTGETNLTTPTADELLETNPFEIVNNYAATYKIKGHDAGNHLYEVELKPNDKSAGIKKAKITINTSTLLPTMINVTFANGQTMSIGINSATVGAGAPAASAFEYPAARYPGVEVIDLR